MQLPTFVIQEPIIKSSFIGDSCTMLHECTVLPSLKKDAILKKLELEAKVRPNHVVGKWELNDRNANRTLGKVI